MNNEKEDESALQEACMGFLGMKRNRSFTEVSFKRQNKSVSMSRPEIYWNEDNDTYCCIGTFADT
jgi:hypothetical protein